MSPFTQNRIHIQITPVFVNYTWLLFKFVATIPFSPVWVPYGITLLSNIYVDKTAALLVWVPYGITLLSNLSSGKLDRDAVWVPYGITLLSNGVQSVDALIPSLSTLWNYTALKLIRSLTVVLFRLSTLWNYTALKHKSATNGYKQGLSTLWNYTALKLRRRRGWI